MWQLVRKYVMDLVAGLIAGLVAFFQSYTQDVPLEVFERFSSSLSSIAEGLIVFLMVGGISAINTKDQVREKEKKVVRYIA